MTQECTTCVSLIDEFAPQSSSVTLQYYQWKSKDSQIEKVVVTDTVDAVFNPLRTELILILRFSHISNHTLISNASLHHWLQR